ncbi:YciI family protein [Opitutus terrae]|uniref:DGPFAETKE family protein n=1 Tax=Opitutus terrae (strain DSM 11246 / JCM 15787 / PB90-1) TaxID=452637 RepID=B1ZT27_OPITP|nr:YciI family protein [Opitutus terrae]ACB75816.1 DGPFAETKE family protein [Opitutus terrae PB90-1]
MKLESSPDQRRHLILLRYSSGATPPTSEEMKTIMARFDQWMRGLYDQGRVAETHGLEFTGKVLRGPISQTTITDGPFAEGKEVVGGYVLLNPSTLEEAVTIARACPGLDYHMIVEVRPAKSRPNT